MTKFTVKFTMEGDSLMTEIEKHNTGTEQFPEACMNVILRDKVEQEINRLECLSPEAIIDEAMMISVKGTPFESLAGLLKLDKKKPKAQTQNHESNKPKAPEWVQEEITNIQKAFDEDPHNPLSTPRLERAIAEIQEHNKTREAQQNGQADY